MARAPEPPASAMQVPPGLFERLARNGFFDPKVRAWARSTVRAEARLNVRRVPIYIATLPKAERARTLAHEIDPTEAISLDFIEAYGAFATAEQQWVEAEAVVTSDLKDDMVVLTRTVNEYERFLADANAGAFGSQAELENAAQTRLEPLIRELKEAQHRADGLRTRNENAVDRANRTQHTFVELLRSDTEAKAVADSLAESDPQGLFARMSS